MTVNDLTDAEAKALKDDKAKYTTKLGTAVNSYISSNIGSGVSASKPSLSPDGTSVDASVLITIQDAKVLCLLASHSSSALPVASSF